MGKIYVNENQIMVAKLLEIYGPHYYDWLCFQITKSNILTLHHIIKVADGGALSIENAALLTKKAQRLLHMCEYRDLKLYIEINDFFRTIIRSGAFDEDLKREASGYKSSLMKTIYK